jgi:hypothetical protein
VGKQDAGQRKCLKMQVQGKGRTRSGGCSTHGQQPWCQARPPALLFDHDQRSLGKASVLGLVPGKMLAQAFVGAPLACKAQLARPQPRRSIVVRANAAQSAAEDCADFECPLLRSVSTCIEIALAVQQPPGAAWSLEPEPNLPAAGRRLAPSAVVLHAGRHQPSCQWIARAGPQQDLLRPSRAATEQRLRRLPAPQAHGSHGQEQVW